MVECVDVFNGCSCIGTVMGTMFCLFFCDSDDDCFVQGDIVLFCFNGICYFVDE